MAAVSACTGRGPCFSLDTTAASLGRLSLLCFLHARTAENVGQAVVSLVARVLEDRSFEGSQGSLSRPRARPGLGIRDRELVANGVAVEARETLNHVQPVGGEDVLSGCLRGTSEIRQVGKVGRIDDKGVTFPVTAGIPGLL